MPDCSNKKLTRQWKVRRCRWNFQAERVSRRKNLGWGKKEKEIPGRSQGQPETHGGSRKKGHIE